MSKTKLSFINFSQSYLTWCAKPVKSIGRFSIDSICRIHRIKTGYIENYYLATGIMAGNVYANKNLTKIPTYSYQIAASRKHYQIFRDYAFWEKNCDTMGYCSDIFDNIKIIEKEKPAKSIDDKDKIAHLITNNAMLNVKLTFSSDDHQVTLEFPVKHINIQNETNKFQIETGPILVPHCSLFDYNPMDDSPIFSTAFIFINNLNNAEFVLKEKIGGNKIHTRFFSKVKPIACEILLLTVH